MTAITTLADVKGYFEWLRSQPLPQGPHECEANLFPILEAFRDWDLESIAELFVQLGLTMCIKRGEEGKEFMREACLQINDVLIKRSMRQYVQEHAN